MNANSELMTMLGTFERDRGIERSVLLEAIQAALLKSAQKSFGNDVRVEISNAKGSNLFRVFRKLIVSNDVKGTGYMSVRRAKLHKPDAQPGDEIEIEVPAGDLGRIAAQVAKQTIIQKLRDAERDVVFNEYRNMVGRVVTGTVKAVVRRDVYVDLGRAEAILRGKDAIPGESFNVGDPVRAYLEKVQGSKPEAGEVAEDSSGPGLILSRRAPELVKALFRQECAEIADGTVEIMAIAREPGFRTKIAVRAHDEKVDPVGSCVGIKGVRVRAVVEELRGEKVDIIQWSPNLYEFARAALAPAQVLDLWDEDVPATEEDWRTNRDIIDSNGRIKIIHAVIAPDQYSLTIGRRGMNVRLTAQILRVKTVDVKKSDPEPTAEERYHAAIDALAELPGIDEDQAQRLVDAGYLTAEGILDPDNDFRNAAVESGFEPDFIEAVWNAATAWRAEHPAAEEEPAPAEEGVEAAPTEEGAAPAEEGVEEAAHRAAAAKTGPAD